MNIEYRFGREHVLNQLLCMNHRHVAFDGLLYRGIDTSCIPYYNLSLETRLQSRHIAIASPYFAFACLSGRAGARRVAQVLAIVIYICRGYGIRQTAVIPLRRSQPPVPR